MPFILAGVFVGAVAYGAWQAFARLTTTPPATGINPQGPALKDLGTFERDPATGIYRVKDDGSVG